MTAVSRAGDWIQTASGVAFWPCDPRPEDVNIEDIAHSLSLLCRYNGHCTAFYSVAQHSVLVSEAAPLDLALWALLHDAAEAYVADVPRPLKRVKRLDDAILADEMAQLMAPPPQDWHLPQPPLGIRIDLWSPQWARDEFLRRFEQLT